MNDQGQVAIAAHAACDPITLEIVRGALRATQSADRAHRDVAVHREKKDFYAALFDGMGRLVVGSNLPIFGDAIGPILEQYPLAIGRWPCQ